MSLPVGRYDAQLIGYADDMPLYAVNGLSDLKVQLDDESVVVQPLDTLELDHLGFNLVDEGSRSALVLHKYGVVADIQPVKAAPQAGILGRVARADHVHNLDIQMVVPLKVCPLYGSGSPYVTGIVVEYGLVDVVTNNIFGKYCVISTLDCCTDSTSGSGNGPCNPPPPNTLCMTQTNWYLNPLLPQYQPHILLTHKTSFTPFTIYPMGSTTPVTLGPPAWDSGWVGIWHQDYVDGELVWLPGVNSYGSAQYLRGYLAYQNGGWKAYFGWSGAVGGSGLGGSGPGSTPPYDNSGGQTIVYSAPAVVCGPPFHGSASSQPLTWASSSTNTVIFTADLTDCGGSGCRCVLGSPGNLVNNEGDAISIGVGTTDCQDLVFSSIGLPPGITFIGGLLSGIITTGAHTNSPYQCVIKVIDGDGCTSVSQFTWTIGTCVCAINSVVNQTNKELDNVLLPITAPACTAPVTWLASGLPTGLTIVSNSGTGALISGTVQPGDSNSSPYTVTLTAIDAAGCTGSVMFTWTITAPTGACGCAVLPSIWTFISGSVSDFGGLAGPCPGLGGISWTLISLAGEGSPCTWVQQGAAYQATLSINIGGYINLVIQKRSNGCFYRYTGGITSTCIGDILLGFPESSPSECCGDHPGTITVTGVP